MPLVSNSKECVGSKLFVLPYYGYGWGRPDLGGGSTSPLESIGPEPFHIRVDEAILCNEAVMGVGGVIDEPTHQFDKYWCACLLRNPDECDFNTRPGDYMIWIAKKQLPIHPAPYPQKALGQWVTFDKSSFCLCGYGRVAESVDWIQDIYERTMNSRRLVKEQ